MGFVSFLIGFAVVLFVYRILIKPYFLTIYYRKQGIHVDYNPIRGTQQKLLKDVLKEGDFYHKWKKKVEKEKKPLAFGMTRGRSIELVLLEPEMLKEFFVNHELYQKYPPLADVFKTLSYKGLVFEEGAMWKKHRKLISMIFHYDFVKEMVPEIASIADYMIEDLKTRNLKGVKIMKEFRRITGEIIGRVFFGQSMKDKMINSMHPIDFLADLIARLGCESYDPLVTMFGMNFMKISLTKSHRKLMSDIKDFRAFCSEIVTNSMNELKQRKDFGGNRRSMFEMFYEQRMKSPVDSLTDEEIIDQYISFMVAGMDKTANLISMATYSLIRNPECKDKLMKELHHLRDISTISMDELNRLDYLTAVLKETLRMATPAPTSIQRIALQDHRLGKINIKKGTLVSAGFLLNNFNDDYHNNAERFLPERWIEESKTLERLRDNPFIFTPFSIGGRNCIGQHLAMAEAKIILGTFLKKYNYQLSDKDYSLKMTQRVLYEPHEEIKYDINPPQEIPMM